MNALPRDASGRDRGAAGAFLPFGSSQIDTLTLTLTKATYNVVLAMVAAMHGAELAEVQAQLARTGEPNIDKRWRQAADIRAQAIYLVNTALNVEQHFLARASGLTPAAVCLALRRIEDRRDEPQIERLITFAETIIKGLG